MLEQHDTQNKNKMYRKNNFFFQFTEATDSLKNVFQNYVKFLKSYLMYY